MYNERLEFIPHYVKPGLKPVVCNSRESCLPGPGTTVSNGIKHPLHIECHFPTPLPRGPSGSYGCHVPSRPAVTNDIIEPESPGGPICAPPAPRRETTCPQTFSSQRPVAHGNHGD